LLTILGQQAIRGQEITGTITGVVDDPSGAPVSGAKVTIHQLETNATRTLVTSNIGSYAAPHLAPGHYDIRIEAAGFKIFEQKDMVLAIDEIAAVNAALSVGANTEVVEVNADQVPTIEVEQSSVGVVLDSSDLQNTPNNGRLSLYAMYMLAPGVQNLAYAPDQVQKYGVTVSVGSTRRNSYGTIDTTLDGTVNEQKDLQRSNQEIPSIDALDEFKMLTNGVPAEYGAQAQIIAVTKSGTNDYHGELLWFNRSKGMNAKPWQNTTHAAASARAPYERNEFGGNFSGPISIPHFYDGRNRSFFFGSYEGYDYTYSSVAQTTQPTDKMRSGDFSDYLPGGNCYSNNSTLTLVNPITGVNYTTAYGNKIPAGQLNSVSQTLLTVLYPHVTNQSICVNSGVANTNEVIGYTQSAKRFAMRVDHRLTDKDQLRATFLHAFYGPYAAGYTDSLAGGSGNIGEHVVDSILGWTHTFSSSLIFDMPVSYYHMHVYRMPHSLYNFGSLINGLGTSAGSGAPTISINEPSSNNYQMGITGVSDYAAAYPGLDQVYDVVPSLTKVFPRHTVKVGGSVLADDYYVTYLPSSGSFTFGKGGSSTSTYSGDAFADFLLGVPAQSSNGLPANQYPLREISFEYAAYIQDDWKVTSKLQLNIGVRYNQQWFAGDQYHKEILWTPEQQKLVYFGNSYPSQYVANYMSLLQNDNAIETSQQAGISNKLYDYLKEPAPHIAPRVGFAYQPTSKTVVRGAFGIYYNLLVADYMHYWFEQTPLVGTGTYSNSRTAYNNSYFTMSNPFVTSGSFSSTTFGASAQHKTVTPYSEAYNLEVERELPGQMSLRVGYVGMLNIKQNDNGSTVSMNLNVPAQSVPYYYSTLQSNYLHQPFNSITGYNYPAQHTSMNALQAGLHKHYHSGTSVNAEFQWTRILGVESFMNPTGANTSDSYGPVGGITPVALNLNYTYALPVGRGHWLGGNVSNLLDKVIGGWQYSGVGSFQEGQPFNITTNQTGTMWNSLRPNVVAGQSLYPSHKSRKQWFNPNAFAAPAKTTDANGNAYIPIGNAGYDKLRGPGWWNMDMNLQKNIKWSNHYNLQVRADSYNIFNHPNFATPNASVYASGTNSALGTITSTSSTPTYEARSVEFGAKFNF
jgi:hypothetical protein